MRTDLPSRVVHAATAQRRYPLEFATLGPALWRADPLADRVVADAAAFGIGRLFGALGEWLDGEPLPADAPTSFAELVDFAGQTPSWVDPDRLVSGAEFFLSTHAAGGIALGARSLVLGYTAPAGNKPLVLSGRLERGVGKRLAETSRFVYDVCKPGNLSARTEGVAAALRVRIIHAHVRKMIREHAQWSDEEWGAPINQHDMLGTVLLFSVVLLQGLETLGLEATDQEAEDYIHLWRYVGYLLGVEPHLLPTSRAHAERCKAFIDLTQAAPDDDARRLTQAFLDAPAVDDPAAGPRAVKFGQVITRALIGDELADQLELPVHRSSHAPPLARWLMRQANTARRLAFRRAVDAGDRYWQWVLANSPAGPGNLTLPRRLMRTVAAAE